MSKCVILREDELELVDLIRELLEDEGYSVFHVLSVPDLLEQARLRSPCIALVDGTSPSSFDMWWLGPELARFGVPAVAFTAHASARDEFAANPQGYAGVIAKPFDTEEFVQVVNNICWHEQHRAAS